MLHRLRSRKTPDEIESLRYDLAAPLREELALAIDPYPRAPGVAFEKPDDADKSDHPFAVLERLKRKALALSLRRQRKNRDRMLRDPLD